MTDLWQPIETAPKDGTIVDLWIDDDGKGERYPNMLYLEGGPNEANDWHDADGVFCLSDIMLRIEQVTHWMPLPSPPK